MKGDIYKIGDHEYIEVYRRLCNGIKCQAEIVMAVDRNDRWHPFDPETGDSHYSTCPDAERYRKRSGMEERNE